MDKPKPTREEIAELVNILKAAAHPLRLGILLELLDCSCCVSDIHTRLGVSQPVASQHLAILRNSGLVYFEQDGASRCYCLSDPGLVERLFSLVQAPSS